MVKNNRKRDEMGSLGFTMIALHRTLSAAVSCKRSIVSQWQSGRSSLPTQAFPCQPLGEPFGGDPFPLPGDCRLGGGY